MIFDLNYSRRSEKKSAKLIYVVTEGSKREPQYFRNFSKDNSRARIEIVKRDDQEDNSPEGLLRKAELFRNSLRRSPDIQIAKNDEFWIVIDVDEWPELSSFVQSANSKKWNVAISNPCFEVWLYYHLESIPPDNLDVLVSGDWKILVDSKTRGGFNCAERYVDFAIAHHNASENYSDLNGVPTRGATGVFQIFDSFL